MDFRNAIQQAREVSASVMSWSATYSSVDPAIMRCSLGWFWLIPSGYRAENGKGTSHVGARGGDRGSGGMYDSGGSRSASSLILCC